MSESCRLYLITPPQIDDLADFAEQLREALAAGDVACVQLRMKSANGEPAPDAEIVGAADKFLPIARAAGVSFLINDRPDLAKKTGADGVHIGQNDMAYKEARALLGEDAIVGVTCHDSKDLALEAGEAGADYVAFGAFFPTQTKLASTNASPDLLAWWRHATIVPSVAIGGIDAGNCGKLVRAGADFLAVSAAIWRDADGPAAAVEKLNRAIAQARE